MDYSVVIKAIWRKKQGFKPWLFEAGLKGNRYFGDKEVLAWENLPDYMPQNLQ